MAQGSSKATLVLPASRLTVMNNKDRSDQASSLYSRRIAGAGPHIHVYSPRLSEDVNLLLNVHETLLSKGLDEKKAKQAITEALHYGHTVRELEDAEYRRWRSVETVLRGEYV